MQTLCCSLLAGAAPARATPSSTATANAPALTSVPKLAPPPPSSARSRPRPRGPPLGAAAPARTATFFVPDVALAAAAGAPPPARHSTGLKCRPLVPDRWHHAQGVPEKGVACKTGRRRARARSAASAGHTAALRRAARGAGRAGLAPERTARVPAETAAGALVRTLKVPPPLGAGAGGAVRRVPNRPPLFGAGGGGAVRRVPNRPPPFGAGGGGAVRRVPNRPPPAGFFGGAGGARRLVPALTPRCTGARAILTKMPGGNRSLHRCGLQARRLFSKEVKCGEAACGYLS